MIHLEPVGPDNWRVGRLRVAGAQKHFVADAATILARAYAYRESRSRALLICLDGVPIGMALYYDWEEGRAFNLSQFYIDERWQGNGYGTEAARLLIEEMRREGRFDRVVLCYIEGNEAARRMYEKVGFHLTGEREEDEIDMEMTL